MRADVPLFASLLAASATAHPGAYNATDGYNSTTAPAAVDNSWTTDDKIYEELEAQVKALKQQLETAQAQTCDVPAGPVAGGSASSPATSGAAPAASQPAAYAPSGEDQASPEASAPAGYSGSDKGDEASPAASAPAGYSGSDNKGDEASPAASAPAGYSGSDNKGDEASPAASAPAGYSGSENKGDESSPVASSPAGYSDSDKSDESSPAPTGYAGEGSSNQGSGAAKEDSKNDGNYYAPNAPTGTKSTSTTTIIVTADVTETIRKTATATQSASGADASSDSDVDIVTATETYCGKGPIPTGHAGSAAASGSSGSGNHASAAVSSVISARPSASSGASSSEADVSSMINSSYGYFGNGTTSAYGTGASSGLLTTTRGSIDLTTSASVPIRTGSGVSSGIVGTGVTSGVVGTGSPSASSASSSASPSATGTVELSDCETFCEELTTFNGWDVTPLTCTQRPAGVLVDTPSGQSSVGCAASFTPQVDLCQVSLNVKTSGIAETYMEVWLPNGNETSWNGRSMSTDNGGLNGCIHYVDMQYVTGLGFAGIGDNAGHNGSSFDGTWTLDNNEAIVDWAYRARHASVEIGKETIDQFYNKAADYSYYIGCSTGGAQGIQSAEKFPNDFDGIISGASANDFNHLQGWSATFRTLTGSSSNDTFLTEAEWTIVQTYVLEQCDEALDGVPDGIIEDPTICKFDASAIPVCSGEDDTSECLTATQIQTVEDVFKPLYGVNGELIYPALFPGSQVDAFRLGLLNGNPQGIARDWFRGGVYNDSSFDITTINAQDIARSQELDDLHGNPSAFRAQLSEFQSAGSKLMMYHGMADPMTSGGNAQRYYLKLAANMGIGNEQIDDFLRLFRISGMAHCGVGGISGAGAWMFGQNGAASSATNNIVSNLVDWVENDNAPETLLGTKFWYDTPSEGIMFERPHCRFPYRTTFVGGDADSTDPASWTCEFIENWQDCAGEFCSEDGTFT